ncbi:nuclear transport factor 2 family protein [Hydrogenophaga sp. 2FB]|uniref:nuclear transport factor 2 family protein n=1 Tax=Hydrogenophaga sp. 2FB TaxID=2502187 RepID=UPI0010F92F5E|nr:nuclear transport factor 2 family protein [Hydrogenophaga sp. 2FB]
MSAEDLAACVAVVRRTARCVDANALDDLCDCFAPDAVLVRPSGQRLEGRQAIRDAYAQRDPHRLTVHVIADTDGHAVSEDEMNVFSRVLLFQGLRGETHGPVPPQSQAVGSFEDRLVRVAHKWQIVQRVACFQFLWTPPQTPA